jgi:galactokinase
LLAAAGDDRYKDPKQVARIAHQSEVLEFNSPGGMMDHFACAMGNTIWLDCQPPYAAEELPSLTNDILLVDSGIPKDTNGVLGGRRKTLENLKIDFTNLELIPDEKSLSENFTKLQQAALHATLNNRRLTVEARSLLKEPSLDIEKLGLLLSGHHRNLSEFLNVSLSEIDDLIEQGIQQGALGGKINGSGCGGSFFFLCHNNSEQLCTYFTTRGYDSYIVKVGKGLSVSIKDQKAEVAVS